MRMRMEMKMKMAKNDKQNIRRSQKGRNKDRREKRCEANGSRGREGGEFTVPQFHSDFISHNSIEGETGGGTLELSWPICHLCDLVVLIVFRNAFQVLPFERKCVKPTKAKKAKNLPKELSINSTGVAQFNCT